MRGLLGLRLRWYAQATALLLLRRWQALVLGVGVFAPVGDSLPGLAAAPVLALVDPGLGIAGRFLALALWQGLWALWAHMQRDAIRGGPFRALLRTLPLSRAAWRRGDLAVLLLADTPLLLLVAAAAAVQLLKQPPLASLAFNAVLLGCVLLSALCAQQVALEGRRGAWPAFVLGNAVAAGVLAVPALLAAALLLGLAAASLLALLLGVPALPARRRGAMWHRPGPLARAGAALGRVLPANLRLSLGILWRQHRAVLLGKALGCALVTAACLGLMGVFGFDARCLPLALIAAVPVALSASGLYRFLQQAHEAAGPWSGALPLPRRWWRQGDVPAVLAFGLPFAAVPGAALWLRAGVPAATVAATLLSFALMLALLRLPQLATPRHAVLLSATGAALWTAAAVAALQP